MKRRAKDIPAKEEKKRPTAGTVIGTIIRSVAIVVGFVLKIIIKALTVLGLWIPLVYSLFGVALYLIFDFNPFNFDALGTLYLCGGIACVIGAAIIAARNLIVKPVKSIYDGYKHPLWEKQPASDAESERKGEETRWSNYKKQKEIEKYSPPEIKSWQNEKKTKGVDYGEFLAPLDDFDDVLEEEKNYATSLDWLPKHKQKSTETMVVAEPPAEKPEVYFSTLEPDVLVHEYSDRFELFRVKGSKPIPIGVEYK